MPNMKTFIFVNSTRKGLGWIREKKRILFGDENQRIHDMHIRRLVTLSDELKDADIRIFKARLALKDFLDEKDPRSRDRKSVKLAIEVHQLTITEMKEFEKNYLSTVQKEHKQAVHDWEEMYKRNGNIQYMQVRYLENAEKRLTEMLESIVAMNISSVIETNTPVEPSASLLNLIGKITYVFYACKEVKELFERLMTNPTQIRGNAQPALAQKMAEIHQGLLVIATQANAIDIQAFISHRDVIDHHIHRLTILIVSVNLFNEYLRMEL